MTDDRTERLVRAILAAQGGTDGQDLDPAERAWAARLVAARREEAEQGPCPDRARRRAHALFARLPETLGETLGRLVFDSWRQAVPAARSLGGERLLRFENGAAALDLQLDPAPRGPGATLALAVEGGGDGLQAWVSVGSAAGRPVDLDAHGTGSLLLEDAEGEIVVRVADEDGDVIVTPGLPAR